MEEGIRLLGFDLIGVFAWKPVSSMFDQIYTMHRTCYTA